MLKVSVENLTAEHLDLAKFENTLLKTLKRFP